MTEELKDLILDAFEELFPTICEVKSLIDQVREVTF